MKLGKKIFSVLCASLAIVSMFSACSAPSVEDVKAQYEKALENSLSSQIFYWKETTLDAQNNVTYKSVNLLPTVDKALYPIVDENGYYPNRTLQIKETYNSKSTYEAICGKSKPSSGDEKDFLFVKKDFDDNGENPSQYKKAVSVDEYIKSDEFKQYTLDTKLAELKELTVDDMDFTAPDCEIKQRGKTTTLVFKVKDEYLARYKEKYGKASIFENSRRVSIEIAIEKISHIIVYQNDPSITDEKRSAAFEKEAYKLFVVYMGPKISVPAYDEKDSKDNSKLAWQDM